MILALFELGLAEALICEFKVVGVLDHFVWAVPPFCLSCWAKSCSWGSNSPKLTFSLGRTERGGHVLLETTHSVVGLRNKVVDHLLKGTNHNNGCCFQLVRYNNMNIGGKKKWCARSSYGGFHEWRYPNSWMAYFLENPNFFHGWCGGLFPF
jgi:hypothetical protein